MSSGRNGAVRCRRDCDAPVRRRLRARIVRHLLGCGLCAAAISQAPAATSFWQQWKAKVGSCPGETQGKVYKARGVGWGVMVSGFVVCKDLGDAYSYRIEFLNVVLDPHERARNARQRLDFDWCGLALYRPGPGEDGIEWLYERGAPIKGTLDRSGAKKIVFGDITFPVDKAAVERATHMVFYLTFHGPMIAFTLI
jgi:hypothetical protein